MAAAPRWKVYDETGRYMAATKDAESAAMLLACWDRDGMTIRDGHAKSDTVFTLGADEPQPGESYDGVAEVCHHRAASLSLGPC